MVADVVLELVAESSTAGLRDSKKKETPGTGLNLWKSKAHPH